MTNWQGRLRARREGVQFEYSLRALCFLLHFWGNYAGSRRAYRNEPNDRLRAIYFDKFAVLVSDIWNELYREYGVLNRDLDETLSQDEVENLITWPFPYQTLPGKHGRGLGLSDSSGPPSYLLKIIRSVQDVIPMEYFDLTMSQSSAASQSDYGRIDAIDDVTPVFTEVRAAIPISSPGEFLSDFTRREVAILGQLENCLKKLGPGEIRALGTHRNVDETISDIKYEFRQVHDKRIDDELIERLESNLSLNGYAKDFSGYMMEAVRKSSENRGSYESGYNIVLQEIVDINVQEAFRATHMEASDIWDHSDIKELARISQRAFGLAQYLEATEYFQQNVVQRESAQSVQDKAVLSKLEAAQTVLSKFVEDKIPYSPMGIFEGDTKMIRSSLRDCLSILLKRLRQTTDY